MPVDHEIFESLNTGQWLWYFYNYMQDKEENYKLHRNMAEYTASFSSPKVVKEVIEKREREEKAKEQRANERFDKQVESMFGRPLAPQSSEKPEDVVKNLDFFSKLSKDLKTQSHLENDKGKNYKYWSDLNLE